jgi:hypothetical protein
MKFVLTEEQAKRLFDKVDNKVTCKECGWEWSLSEGGDDPYVCHECGHDNAEDKFIGKRVMVYYNLHKHTFSVTYKSKVILHADYVKLGDVEFRVRKGGKERVRTEMAKNVHAFVIGDLLEYCQFPCENIPNEPTNKVVTYNPYKYDSFVYKSDEKPVYNAKEVDMINLKNKLFVINEVVKPIIEESVDTQEGSKFTYITLKPFSKGSTKRYYFNKVFRIPNKNTNSDEVTISGNQGEFVFDKNVVTFDESNQKMYIDKSVFDEKYPNFKPIKNSEKIGINSTNVKKALEKAFPENWYKGDDVYTPGLRGGDYTIGSRINDDEETWSIMNYFDTKDEIHDLLYLKYMEDESNENIVDWMANIFKNDKEFTELLVNRQWSSIENGLKLERDSVNSFFATVNPSNIKFYPHGSIMDRFHGVDVTIDSKNYQIKPLVSYVVRDDEYIVGTYGMRDYTKKSKVDFIAYANSKEVLIFKNSDYTLISRFKVSHKQPPLEEIIN